MSAVARQLHVEELAAVPSRLREAVRGLSDPQLDTPYRPSGWTVRQLVHPFADSHINAYVRFRLALTENEPTIKPYDQEKPKVVKIGRHQSRFVCVQSNRSPSRTTV